MVFLLVENIFALLLDSIILDSPTIFLDRDFDAAQFATKNDNAARAPTKGRGGMTVC